jgi:hypothetical protein
VYDRLVGWRQVIGTEERTDEDLAKRSRSTMRPRISRRKDRKSDISIRLDLGTPRCVCDEPAVMSLLCERRREEKKGKNLTAKEYVDTYIEKNAGLVGTWFANRERSCRCPWYFAPRFHQTSGPSYQADNSVPTSASPI